jgi:hypothetical protein
MSREGLAPPPMAVAGWRPAAGEAFPLHRGEEVVSYLDFHMRVLGLPAHRFFPCFLDTFSLELQHLTPNSVLQLAMFVTLCKAFLSIKSHAALFLRLFEVRGQPPVGQSGPDLSPVGKATVQLRGKIPAAYPQVQALASLKGWHEKWLYIRNPRGEGAFRALPAPPPGRLTPGGGRALRVTRP